MNKIWMNSGSVYTEMGSGYEVSESLPVGVYNVNLTRTGFHLDKYADKFIFPYKVYGLQEDFIEHVIKTYNNTTGNLGIMFTGTKGTGKTVTAKELANKLNLPVIIVKSMGENNQDMIEFLSGIEEDCIFFLDEFEKNFEESDSTVLQIMDGVYNSNYRKIFLLTTNRMKVNNNLIGRPSRIRYIKNFGDLDLKIVNEYLDDTLKIPEARQELIDFVDSLSISTIDILKTIVDEVNIHGIEGLKKAKEFFNVEANEYEYVYVSTYTTVEEIAENKDKYTIENFLKSAKNYDIINKNKGAQEKIKEDGFNSFTYGIYYSTIKFSNLEIGDNFMYSSIIAIDKKLNVVVTREGRSVSYYWVRNTDNKPSLYRTENSLIL